MDTRSPDPVQFVAETVLKRDAFSETVAGHAQGDPSRRLVLRRLAGLPWYTRWFAWVLARREIRGLKAVAGIEGVPELVRVDREGILRGWSRGTPLNLARPEDPAFYRDARRLLRDMRARGVTHNDLAKPQNWLMTPEGRAAVIDFQLSRVHGRRGRVFRIMGYEDLRHLVKQKRRYAVAHLTPTERVLLQKRSGPGQLWRQTGKELYKFITRRMFNWADGEGTEHLVDREGPGLRRDLLADPAIRDLALSPVPLPGRGVGLYGFAETDLTPEVLRSRIPTARLTYLQPVACLPRDAEGAVRGDILQLIAMNRHDELAELLAREPAIDPVVAPIIAGRLNLSDRILRGR